jgi:hypothetical protein
MRPALNAHQKIPKVSEYAELTLTDGTVLSGYVFVDATARIQDLLNDSAPLCRLSTTAKPSIWSTKWPSCAFSRSTKPAICNTPLHQVIRFGRAG